VLPLVRRRLDLPQGRCIIIILSLGLEGVECVEAYRCCPVRRLREFGAHFVVGVPCILLVAHCQRFVLGV
jgi:hypothetical protein